MYTSVTDSVFETPAPDLHRKRAATQHRADAVGSSRTIDSSNTSSRTDASGDASGLTAAHSRQAGRSMLVFLALSGICIGFDKVYALFGHGVTSAAMSGMYLYPLLGGALLYFLLWVFVPGQERRRPAVVTQTPDARAVAVAAGSRETRASCWRFFCNAWNSGIATLTVGSLLHGILEIAGTESAWLTAFTAAGIGLLVLGAVSLLRCRIANKATQAFR